MRNRKSKIHPLQYRKTCESRFWSFGILILFVICHLLFVILPTSSYAEEEAGDEYMTRREAVARLSAADFMRKKIGELLSWTIGYDISKISRVRLTPSINYVRAIPRKVPPDNRTILEIVASVDDPGGLGNIAGVRADLSSIGRLPNTMLVDNGLFGDIKEEDGIYTLQTSIPSEIELGPKEVPVAVANKKGWLALAKTTLDVKKNPVIIEAKILPERVRADGKEMITLLVKIDNPGRVEDLQNVTIDLRALGFTELLSMRNDGQAGDAVAGDNVFTLQFVVPEYVKAGKYVIRIGASNLASGYVSEDLIIETYK